MLDKLFTLQRNRGQFVNGDELSAALINDQALRSDVALLTKVFLGRVVSGCNSCYVDAYFELLTISKEKAIKKMETKFALRAGALLTDVVNYDISKSMTNANISDELALYHLRTNPSCHKFFTKLPDNVDELIVGVPMRKLSSVEGNSTDLVSSLKKLLEQGVSKSAARKSIKSESITHKMIDKAFITIGV